MNIGIFDSGIGGLTVLTQARQLLPQENYIFYADTDHVPYGTKTKEEIISYVRDVIRFMQEKDCKAVVIACNTATSAAAKVVRAEFDLPIIGIEPAVKPAVAQSQGKRVMVIATPLTIKEEKLKNLVASVDDLHQVDLVAFPQLVTFAERHEFTGEAVENYILDTLSGYDMTQYREFVLGCTHFNYFKDTYAKVFPQGIHLIDGSEGTIKQLKRVLEQKNLLEDRKEKGNVRFFYSGREAVKKDELETFDMLCKRLDEMRKITITG